MKFSVSGFCVNSTPGSFVRNFSTDSFFFLWSVGSRSYFQRVFSAIGYKNSWPTAVYNLGQKKMEQQTLPHTPTSTPHSPPPLRKEKQGKRREMGKTCHFPSLNWWKGGLNFPFREWKFCFHLVNLPQWYLVLQSNAFYFQIN